MVQQHAAEATVRVDVDPRTAFHVFTAEIDDWWLRGPINFVDATHAAGMECEPGPGGRIVKLRDNGEPVEVGRFIAWEPGARLTWRSSEDDTEVDVRFEAEDAGTRVTVRQYLVDGGKRLTGAAWTRIAPLWFQDWCARRAAGHLLSDRSVARLNLILRYQRPVAAARWIAGAFGLELPKGLPESGDDAWIEFRIGVSRLILMKRAAEDPVGGCEAWVYVDDLEGHANHSRRAGARIVCDIREHGYRWYTAEDLEGHRWTFVQSLAGLTPI